MHMNSKNLKRRPTPKKNVAHEPLKQQSQKIQNKLESLRAQIDLKKKQITQNKKKETFDDTKTSLQSYKSSKSYWNSKGNDIGAVEKFLKNGHTKVNNNQSEQHSKNSKSTVYIEEILKQLNIPQNVGALLSDKNINTIEELLQITDEQVDTWKEIGVGYRVKLKKFIAIAQQQRQTYQQNSPQKNMEKKEEDIEAIMKRRQQNRVFVKISDRDEQQFYDEADQIIEEPEKENEHETGRKMTQEREKQEHDGPEDEEDVMIESLNQAFFGKKKRKSMLRDKSKQRQSGQRKGVHWDKGVENYDRSNKKVYTEKKSSFCEISVSQLDLENKSLLKKQQNAYCWSCLQKITKNVKIQEKRVFCSEKCMEQYQKMVTSISQQKLMDLSKQIENEQQPQDEGDKLEVVDLSLM